MNETVGPLLAVGNVAEIFEWGSRIVKLYKSTAAKPAAFARRQFTRPRRQWDFPFPGSGPCKKSEVGGGSCSIG